MTPPSGTTMKRVSSNSSLSGQNAMNKSLTMSLSTYSITNVFIKVWQVIELYRLDPCPKVAKMAETIHNDIRSKAFTNKDNNSDSSTSEPASPNTRQSYLFSETITTENTSENPKQSWHTQSDSNKHHSGRVSVSALSSPYLPHSNNYNSFMTQYSVKRTIFGKDPTNEEISETKYRNGIRNESNQSNGSFNEFQTCRKPLITTSFIEWCTRHFSKPCPHNDSCRCGDIETNNHDIISEWKYKLIKNQYEKSKYELETNVIVENSENKIKRIVNTNARLIAFHPFEKSAALASKQSFMAWNLIDNETQCYNSKSSAKITDIHLINSHEKALVMVGADDGSVKVWRNVFSPTFSSLSPDEVSFTPNPKLSIAFFMFEDMPTRRSEKNRLIMSWNQTNQMLVAGGNQKFVRLWDSNKEMKVRDFITGSECATSICTNNNHLICVGCSDGTVKVFDDRVMSNDGRVFSLTNRSSNVVNAKIWPEINQNTLNAIVGHRSGEICWYDKRFTGKATRIETVSVPMTAMAFHDKTDVFAW